MITRAVDDDELIYFNLSGPVNRTMLYNNIVPEYTITVVF